MFKHVRILFLALIVGSCGILFSIQDISNQAFIEKVELVQQSKKVVLNPDLKEVLEALLRERCRLEKSLVNGLLSSFFGGLFVFCHCFHINALSNKNNTYKHEWLRSLESNGLSTAVSFEVILPLLSFAGILVIVENYNKYMEKKKIEGKIQELMSVEDNIALVRF